MSTFLMDNNTTDCRDQIGITVGLIDSIIVQFRLLRSRDLSPVEVQEALKDLSSDEDLSYILSCVNL